MLDILVKSEDLNISTKHKSFLQDFSSMQSKKSSLLFVLSFWFKDLILESEF